MTPAARLQAAIDILAALEGTNQPADRLLRDWFRTRRYAGSKDRKAVTERVFSVLRDGTGGASRARVIASLAAEGLGADEIAALFTGERYAPEPLTDAERDSLGAPKDGEALAPFLQSELQRRFGDTVDTELAALKLRAPIDLRVNTLKATRDEVLGQLRAQGFAAEPTPHAPHGIRIPPGEGSAALSRSALFEGGAFEFQDESAQVAALLCAAKPGSRILDLGAGAGGKSLALAAAMGNQGQIVAADTDANRLAQLTPRAARAGASIIHPLLIEREPPLTPFDAVFVDAPCSGSGTWRRQPELKARLTAARLAELMAVQDALLETAAARMHPRGHVVYATCSLLPCENEDRVEAFLARHTNFAIRPARDVWRMAGGKPWKATGDVFRASPASTGTDGFFAAILVRKKAPSASLDKPKAER